MLIIMYTLLVTLLLVLFLNAFSFLISETTALSREELSPYECGFEHYNVSRIPFSLRYFFLTLIFLLFDLEIVFMLFIPYYVLSNHYLVTLIVLFVFLLVLYFSLLYEWNDGTLEWLS